jgi:osmoprotectant transport system ATP-binding protein
MSEPENGPNITRFVGAAPPPLIELDCISKAYGDEPRAVDGVSLGVHERELVAIVGPSGSGKTTTLKAINRLIDIDAGAVRVGGEDVTTLPPHELRRRIGYVFQGVGLFPHMTVRENIAIVPKLLRWRRAEIDARVLELLHLVHLPREHAERLPSALSGGERQRVGVARALAARPRIMLLDEPFGALDPLTRDALGTEYRRLHDAMGLTTLMVTHDMLEAMLLAHRIVVMRGGRIVADDTPQALLRSDAQPDVRALMDTPLRQSARVQALLETAATALPGAP